MASFASKKIRALIGVESCVFRLTSKSDFQLLAPSDNSFEKPDKEQAVARWVIDHGKPAGASTDTLSGAEGFYVPLQGSLGTFGALGVHLGTRDLETSQRHIVEGIASLLATALERAQYAKASHISALRAETERMRGDLLSAVSHDLRTPLASITGAASVLKDDEKLSSQERELAATILEESDRMARLVRNLLDMTRVQGQLDLSFDWYNLNELVDSAVIRTKKLFEKPVQVSRGPNQLLVHADGLLIEQVIVNLLENAARHAGKDSEVQILVGRARTMALVDVIDNGPGIPEAEQSKIFDRFRGKSTGSIGLGLAICKAVLEAHNGQIYLVPSNEGADFRIEFPLGEEASSE